MTILSKIYNHNAFKASNTSLDMGRIKSTLVKRTARQFVENASETFSSDFKENKKALGETMPSKRIRNKVAGQLSRIKKNSKKIIQED